MGRSHKMCRNLEASIHVANSGNWKCLIMAGEEIARQRLKRYNTKSYLCQVNNFELYPESTGKLLNAFKQERDMMKFDCDVKNIFERGRLDSGRPEHSCSNPGDRRQGC